MDEYVIRQELPRQAFLYQFTNSVGLTDHQLEIVMSYYVFEATDNSASIKEYTLYDSVLDHDLWSMIAMLNHGADINGGNETLLTPMHLSALGGLVDFVEALIAHGANIDPRDIWGMTPLHCAVFMKRRECIKKLMEAGADPFIRWFPGWNAIDMSDKKSKAIIDAVLKMRSSESGPSKCHDGNGADTSPSHE